MALDLNRLRDVAKNRGVTNTAATSRHSKAAENSIESGKTSGIRIVGTIIILLIFLCLWGNKWHDSHVRQQVPSVSDGPKYADAYWKCKGKVNVREGAGVDSPGKGSLSSKKFTQRCEGRVMIFIGSETTVSQSNGNHKWIRVWTPNGEGWVNRDLVSY